MILFFLLFILIPTQATATPSDIERQFDEAIHLYQEGKDREAEVLFLQIIEKDQTVIRPRQFLGLIYTRTGRLDQAAQTFREIIALAPDHHGGYYGLGLVLKQQRAFAAAKAAFMKAIERSDRHAQAWFQLGQIAELERRVKEAVLSYQKAIAADPDSSEGLQAQRRLKEIGETPETAEKVQTLLTQAAESIRNGRMEEAIQQFQKGTELLPEGAIIREMLGNLSARLGHLEEAVSSFKGAIERDPSLLSARISLGVLYQDARKEEEAIQTYQAIFLINRNEAVPEVRLAKEALFDLLDRKDARERTERGTRLMNEKKMDEALREFKAAIELRPDDGLPYYNLALFYFQTGQYDAALKTVDEALETEPNSKALFLLRGKIYSEKRHPSRSLGAYLKVLSLSDGRMDLLSREAQAGLFQSIFLLSKTAADLTPLLAEAIRERGEGKVDAAQATLAQAIGVAPEAPLPYFYLGEIYRDKGEEEPALAAFKRAVEADSGFYPAQLALARSAVHLKRYRTATAAYEPLLRLSKEQLDPLGTSREDLEKEKQQLDAALEAARTKTRDLFSQGERAFAEGKLEEALTHFLSAADEEPDNPALFYSIGITYASLKNWKEALSAFEKTLAIDPNHLEARFRLGVVQEGTGELIVAKRTYQTLLRRAGQGSPLSQEAQKRLTLVNALLKQHREADRHEQQGLALSGKESDPEHLPLALWHLQRAADLRPDLARASYNIGLLQERIYLKRDEAEIDHHQADPSIESYRKAIERETGYLPAYLRLGQLYEWQEQTDDAVEIYRRALKESQGVSAPEAGEIQERLEALTKRFFGSIGYQIGIDSNFTLSTQPEDDYFTSLSASLAYYLYRTPRLQIPITYLNQTILYYRVQTYFTNHGISLGWRHRPVDDFSYELGGRFNVGLAKDQGVSLFLFEGSASATWVLRIPSTLSVGYVYNNSTFLQPTQIDSEEHRATLSAVQRFGENQEGDLTYTWNQRQVRGSERVQVAIPVQFPTPGIALVQVVRSARHNSFMGNQIGGSYRWWLSPQFQLRGSTGLLLQNFLYPDLDEGIKRRNTLFYYGAGVVYQWSPSIRLSLDYNVQQNRSNLKSAFFDQNDILQRRSSALGDYTKRLILGEIHVDF